VVDRLAVLVDGRDESGASVGRHYGQAPDIDSVCLIDPPVEPGQIVEVAVTGTDGYDLRVTPLE
jgi:hypothetical protein